MNSFQFWYFECYFVFIVLWKISKAVLWYYVNPTYNFMKWKLEILLHSITYLPFNQFIYWLLESCHLSLQSIYSVTTAVAFASYSRRRPIQGWKGSVQMIRGLVISICGFWPYWLAPIISATVSVTQQIIGKGAWALSHVEGFWVTCGIWPQIVCLSQSSHWPPRENKRSFEWPVQEGEEKWSWSSE